jgi:hypothetical protein
MLSSPWKLSYGATPLVILDFGERLDDEIDWGGQRQAEVISLVDSSAPFLRDSKNLTYRIRFTVQRDSGTDVQSRTAMLDGLIAWAGKTPDVLKVQAAGIATFPYWQFSRAIWTAHSAKGRTVGLGLNLTTYEITATGLAKVSS